MERSTFTVTKTYELGLPVSEGSMADIYEAVDSGLGRRVAVKCLRTEHLENAAMRERFAEEAAIMGRLDHPGALAVHDAGLLPDGRDFYTMRMVQGRTLRELLEERDARSVRDRGRMPAEPRYAGNSAAGWVRRGLPADFLRRRGLPGPLPQVGRKLTYFIRTKAANSPATGTSIGLPS